MTPRELELFFALCKAELEVMRMRHCGLTSSVIRKAVNEAAEDLIFDVSETDRDWTDRRLAKYFKDRGDEIC